MIVRGGAPLLSPAVWQGDSVEWTAYDRWFRADFHVSGPARAIPTERLPPLPVTRSISTPESQTGRRPRRAYVLSCDTRAGSGFLPG